MIREIVTTDYCRQAGRTTRAIKSAVDAAVGGATVTYVVSGCSMFRLIEQVVDEAVAGCDVVKRKTKHNRYRSPLYEFVSGGSFYVATVHDVLRGHLRVGEGAVHVDHHAVEAIARSLLMEVV